VKLSECLVLKKVSDCKSHQKLLDGQFAIRREIPQWYERSINKSREKEIASFLLVDTFLHSRILANYLDSAADRIFKIHAAADLIA
jgi:hypothetical protein